MPPSARAFPDLPVSRDAPPLNRTFGSPGQDLGAVVATVRLDENECNKAEVQRRGAAAMTAAQFETIGETEVEAILRWRFDVLVRSGYDIASAIVLASHVEIDLHKASALLRQGCPSETALEILL